LVIFLREILIVEVTLVLVVEVFFVVASKPYISRICHAIFFFKLFQANHRTKSLLRRKKIIHGFVVSFRIRRVSNKNRVRRRIIVRAEIVLVVLELITHRTARSTRWPWLRQRFTWTLGLVRRSNNFFFVELFAR
jgi:hypothetical protein